MKKYILSAALLAALAISTAPAAIAAEKKKGPETEAPTAPPTSNNKPTEKPGEKPDVNADKTKVAKLPFSGKVSAMDASAKTFTIKGKKADRVFHITDGTKFMKNGAAADMKALAEGDEITGSYVKNGETLEAVSVKMGVPAKGEKKKGPETEAATAPPTSNNKPTEKPGEKPTGEKK